MAITHSFDNPSRIIFPDLISHCPAPLRLNPYHKVVHPKSTRWLLSRCPNLTKKRRAAYYGLKGSLLTAMCYPLADYYQFRVCCDYVNYLFHLDNICDEMDNNGTWNTASEVLGALHNPHTFKPSSRVGALTQSFWRRHVTTGSAGAQQRFIDTFSLFFRAVAQQADDRHSGNVPDVESYIAMRRDTSGCKPCFALIEYANHLDLPSFVMEHPTMVGLEEATNDLISWSNDIFSYNVEQSKGDTHNIVVVVQRQEGLDMQSAVDYVGELCVESMERFRSLRAMLPSWGPEIDAQVQVYVDGLGDWMIGNLVWSFETERYFGKAGHRVLADLSVDLLPRCK